MVIHCQKVAVGMKNNPYRFHHQTDDDSVSRDLYMKTYYCHYFRLKPGAQDELQLYQSLDAKGVRSLIIISNFLQSLSEGGKQA